MAADFDNALDTLKIEIEGQATVHDKAATDLRVEYEQKLDKLNTEFNAAQAKLLEQLTDLQNGKAILSAALDKADEIEPRTEDAADK